MGMNIFSRNQFFGSPDTFWFLDLERFRNHRFNSYNNMYEKGLKLNEQEWWFPPYNLE
jgi:hypothetical protein